MMNTRSLLVLCTVVLLATADFYMQNPRGMNGRNRERNENRNNANRMMDTQNNAKGGYPYCGNATVVDVGDGPQFYVGSMLRIEWTLQHSCGPDSDALCSVILQYACEDTMPYIRDGYPSDDDLEENDDNNDGYLRATFQDNNDAGTQRIPCPSSVSGCQGNFGDDLDDDEELYLSFYTGAVVDEDGDGDGDRYGSEYGYHESFEYYRDQCLFTQRNYGLYLADQNLNGNRARYTRQNPNGNRHGFECPEERDYYPWWQPTPWKDIAVLVTDEVWCDFYQENSFNVKSRYQCEMTDDERAATDDGLYPIFEDECFANSGSWVEVAAHGIDAPECRLHDYSRDNHLGNAVSVDGNGDIIAEVPHMAFYDWTIPEEAVGQKCVIRGRYNMSGIDYPSMNTFVLDFDEEEHGTFWDWKFNCEAVTSTQTDLDDASYSIDVDQNLQCAGVLSSDVVPLYNRPFVEVFEGAPELAIAFNTNQVGRTFQDRSYVFEVLERDGVSDSDEIWNLNYRGRRGNIVQCYPAVEYDFVPTNLTIDENTYVHIQFCGSDFNTARNPNNGEGWQYSDRTNMVQTSSIQTQFPYPSSDMDMWDFDTETAMRFAYVGIDVETEECHEFPNDEDGDNDNSIYNCGTLNPAPARFDGGLMQFNSGIYNYVSTRNNNFSNRSQKGTIVVESALSAGETAAIVIGALAGAGMIVGGAFYYSKRNPDSKVAGVFRRGGGGETVGY